MELYYQGRNITDDVVITSAVHRDVSGGRCDSLDIRLDHARQWYQWGPKADDQIEIVDNGYSTGAMFVSAIVPEGDSYRILATAAKSGCGRRANMSYENKSLEDLLSLSGAECGMDYRIFGMDKRTMYPFLLRQWEGCGAFLNRLAGWEGAVLKTYSGRFAFISVQEAQSLTALETIEITERQPGVTYQRKDKGKLKSLTVCTPYARVSASDEGVERGNDKLVCCLPARDAVTAGRWARGMLLTHNRAAEQLRVESVFHPAWTAMARVDTEGPTDASGSWVIDECVHDLVNKTSRAVMLRCIDTVV